MMYLFVVALSGWLVPGGGYFLLKEKKRALIILAGVSLTFVLGLHIGSIGVINAKSWWYGAQLLCNPVVGILGLVTSRVDYSVYGKPAEIGQIYTSVAGLLNLLCIVSSVYLAYCRSREGEGSK